MPHSLWDKIQLLWQWWDDGYLEQRHWAIGVDDQHPIRGEKLGHLLLRTEGNAQQQRRRREERLVEEEESVWVFRYGYWIHGEDEIIPIMRRLRRQVSGPQRGRGSGVWMDFVPFGELQDDRFGWHTVEWLFMEVRGIRHRVTGARHPLRSVWNWSSTACMYTVF